MGTAAGAGAGAACAASAGAAGAADAGAAGAGDRGGAVVELGADRLHGALERLELAEGPARDAVRPAARRRPCVREL